MGSLGLTSRCLRVEDQMARKDYDHQWQQVRKVILERDGHTCQIRFDGCLGHATDVDHIMPLAEGGARLDSRNLRAACKPCNNARNKGRSRQLVAAIDRQTQPAPALSDNW